jgi:hypothetical protein
MLFKNVQFSCLLIFLISAIMPDFPIRTEYPPAVVIPPENNPAVPRSKEHEETDDHFSDV